ncbi:MAG TPA: VWA domain-containing protein [Chthoniobacterales bacterium]|jgi:VWFA-related protein|nr:VWA domain-containing protein [Chthoniobacterales bacterium]
MLDEGKGLIHLDVSVADGTGEPVPGLNREDFELLDEGHPQSILSFHAFSGKSARPDPPTQVILFVDTFKMSNVQASQVQLGIEQFLRQNGGHLGEPVWIFGLSDDGFWTIAHHDSTDGNSLASDLSYRSRVVLSRQPDALRALAFIAAGQRRKRGRKVLLWIGPGCGTGTGVFPADRTLEQKTFNPIYWFATLFREARLSIDELSVDQAGPCLSEYQQYLSGVRTVRDANERFLYKKVLAIESGGSVADEGRDLVAEMNRCVQRAASFYTLSFDPPVAVQSHEYHSLQVRVDRSGLVARTNTGYYDEPFYSDQPNPTVRRVTVEELNQLLSQAHGREDDKLAEELSELELTERLSFVKLSGWTAKLRNKNVRQALIAVADASAFLEPPPGEIPNQAAPGDAEQQRILVLAEDYLKKSIPKLPDFYATRTTLRYEDTSPLNDDKTRVEYQPLHVAELSKARVLYRAGSEIVESRGSEPDDSSDRFMITHGAFGPLLAEVRRAMGNLGQMKWVRWENGPEGNRAVFGFVTPATASRYFEGGCCLPDDEGQDRYRIQAGYRGEIAIDQETGTILRLQMQFDLHNYVPMDLDEIVIEYGPVEIGGKTYVCPVRSVSVGRARSLISLKEWDQDFMSFGPYTTHMNDMQFSNYHVFRSESRMLTGFTPLK